MFELLKGEKILKFWNKYGVWIIGVFDGVFDLLEEIRYLPLGMFLAIVDSQLNGSFYLGCLQIQPNKFLVDFPSDTF